MQPFTSIVLRPPRGTPKDPDEPASHRRPLLTLTGNPRGFELPLEFPPVLPGSAYHPPRVIGLIPFTEQHFQPGFPYGEISSLS